jgi:hypothetical protein
VMKDSRWRWMWFVAAVVVLVVLWGGYGRHWAWTGINGGTATLWDWLHLLLLPVVVAILPVWLSRETRIPRRHQHFALAAFAVFSVLVLAGYSVPWSWTGFSGNRLWDWLELLALPVAVALTPILGELRAAWNARWSAVAAAAAAAFIVVIAGGYLWSWSWTGFEGNTLWNWMQLLLLPLLLPMIVVPALKPRATAALTERADRDQEGIDRDQEGTDHEPDATDRGHDAGATTREQTTAPEGASGQAAPREQDGQRSSLARP